MGKFLKILKYFERKPSLKDIMICSALLVLAIMLMKFFDKFLDESWSTVGTIVSLGIVILVGILAVRRNKQKDSRNVISSLFVSCGFRQRFLLQLEFLDGNFC